MDKFDIYKIFFIAFGSMQVIANASYLLKKNGIDLAKKQHQELPSSATEQQFRTKVVCMLIFGVLFLSTGLITIFTRSSSSLLLGIVLAIYTIYALVETIYYKLYWKTVGAFLLPLVLLIVLVI